MKAATIDAQTLDDPNLSAARTLLRAAGHDDDAIDRAFCVLQERDRCADVASDNLLSAREVYDWLGISLSTLWRWKIPHIRVGGLRRFYHSDIEKFLNRRYIRAKK